MGISTWRRLTWHLYRTPLAKAIKVARRAGVREVVRERRQAAQEMPVSPEQDALADRLNRDGYVMLSQALDPGLMRALGSAGDEKLALAASRPVQQSSNHKDFWARLLDEDMVDGMLPTDNPFVAFALQPQVISILSRALGEVPYLDYVLLTLSKPTGKALAYSQLWHKDHDDTRVIKLFVYLTDVQDQDDGPFTFIPGPPSDTVGFALHSHRPDAAVSALLPHVKPVVAPRLTAFLVETSRCLHMGSRLAEGHQRLLYTATYITVPRLFPEPPPRFRLNGNEPPTTRLVLSPN